MIQGRRNREVIQSWPQGPKSKISPVDVVSLFSRHFLKIDYAFLFLRFCHFYIVDNFNMLFNNEQSRFIWERRFTVSSETMTLLQNMGFTQFKEELGKERPEEGS